MFDKNGFANWLTPEGKATLERGILLPGESQRLMFKRVSKSAAAWVPKIPKAYENFYRILSNGILSLATPVAANMGTDRGFPVSCFAQTPYNSIRGIYSAILESAMLSKLGGGLGIDLSNLIGESNVVQWAKGYDLVGATVSQGGGVRKGSVALYLDIEHPDIWQFLHSKELLEGDIREKIDCNIAVKVSDVFMQKCLDGDPESIKKFAKVLELRMKYGSPYIFFSDNVLRADPPTYKHHGLKTTTSNLCLEGGTLVLTKEGNKAIKTLVGREVEIWDGIQWVKNKSFRLTGTDKLVRINLGGGRHIDMTLDHRCPLVTGKVVRARDLKPGDELASWHDRQADGHLASAFLKGYLWASQDMEMISRPFEGKFLVSAFESTLFPNQVLTADLGLTPFRKELLGFVQRDIKDLERWDFTSCCHFLKGVAEFNKDLLSSDDSTIKHLAKVIDVEDAAGVISMGLMDIIHQIENRSKFTVVGTEILEGQHPVYCTTVPTTSFFALSNGVITGNCSEIFLHTDEQHTFTCVLSSINLTRWDENPEDIYWALLFLDCVNEEFIQKASRSKHKDVLQNALNTAVKGRALGLGVIGYHTRIQSLGMPWEGSEANDYNRYIFKHLREAADAAQVKLAEQLGEPEWCKGFGRRNTHSLAIAPTTSNSVIGGGVSPGIEPLSSNYSLFAGSRGSYVRKNPVLNAYLESIGENHQATWDKILENDGSVKGIDFIPYDLFKTAKEIDQSSLIRQAADRQPFIDQGQSLNLFLNPDITPMELWGLHIKAWSWGLKSLYYVRSQSKALAAISPVRNNQVDAPNVSQEFIIYSRPDCPWCVKAKDILKGQYQEFHKETGRVPEIYHKGKFIGGYESLCAYLNISPEISEPTCSGCDG